MAQETSIATLLDCLRAKADAIPLETINIGERFIQKIATESSTDFKTVVANSMSSYIQTLRTQHDILHNLVRLGEIVEKGKESGPEAQRHREVWWFVARTVLTQAGQDI